MKKGFFGFLLDFYVLIMYLYLFIESIVIEKGEKSGILVIGIELVIQLHIVHMMLIWIKLIKYLKNIMRRILKRKSLTLI